MDKEETKLVYTYDNDGKYTGTKTLDYTDRSPISDTWQIPAGCTETAPPEPTEDMELIWNGENWEQQPKPEEPEPPEPTEPTEDEKLQIEANSTRTNLQTMAINAMMMTLAGNDIAVPDSGITFSGIPQSARCSLSQILFIFKTLESPAVTNVSATLSSVID